MKIKFDIVQSQKKNKFMKHFGKSLNPPLLASVKITYLNQEVSVSQKQVVIELI